jgi:hypothetical protein
MTDNYANIVGDNLNRLYSGLPPDLAANLPGKQAGDRFVFTAFGETCTMGPERILLGNGDCPSVLGILISLYALNARPDLCVVQPFKAFKEFPDSMPYVGAFTTHTQQLLVPLVSEIKKAIPAIVENLNGEMPPQGAGGDFSFVVHPLPKIALCYIFYEADDDFPPSVTTLFSHNARLFLSVDGLADVGEYTSKKIRKLIRE